jgi:hypothetical protein
MNELQITVSDSLDIAIGNSSIRLSPASAIDVAEALMRKGCRRLVDEEIAARVLAVKSNGGPDV